MALSFSYAVLEWAKSKPADEAYDYCDNGDCAIARFLKETGRAKDPYVAGNRWSEGLFGSDREFDWRISDAANGYEDEGDPDTFDTFGAFAKRLESALA